MSHELKEPRQAGDPTRLESNDAALTGKSTGIPTEGLNLARPERLEGFGDEVVPRSSFVDHCLSSISAFVSRIRSPGESPS